MVKILKRLKVLFLIRLTAIEGEFYGLSYIDSCNLEYDKIRNDTSLVNSYTGCRNVCVYKQWNGQF